MARLGRRWSLFVTVAIAAGVVGAALWKVPTFYERSLPDRLATHWGANGKANGSSALSGISTLFLVPWLVVCAIALAVGMFGWHNRANRGIVGATLGGGAGLFGSITFSTIAVNLGATDWREVRLPGWHVAVVLSALAAGGAAGWCLGYFGPAKPAADRPNEVPEDPGTPRVTLGAGERTVWIGYCRNGWLLVIGAVATVTTLGPAVLPTLKDGADAWDIIALGVSALVIVLALTTFSSVRILVDERGLQMRFGLLGYPTRRIPLERVASARAAVLLPRQVGGWGYRKSPAGSAWMLRGGQCLVIKRSDGRADFIVSVDDAERGAALLNTLRDRGHPGHGVSQGPA